MGDFELWYCVKSLHFMLGRFFVKYGFSPLRFVVSCIQQVLRLRIRWSTTRVHDQFRFLALTCLKSSSVGSRLQLPKNSMKYLFLPRPRPSMTIIMTLFSQRLCPPLFICCYVYEIGYWQLCFCFKNGWMFTYLFCTKQKKTGLTK